MPDRTEPPIDAQSAPLAQVESVRVEFGDLVAVNDVSMTLMPGMLVGLIGPNGAGKTTLMRAMAGLQPPTSGRTLIMGQDVFGEFEDVRRHVGLAPDSPPVYEDLTVYKFLTFIALAYGMSSSLAVERIDYWLEHLWLTDKREDKIGNLSRGMRQRVTVARTLVPNPTVILLDEPSAGLDPAGRIQFRKVLASLRDQGRALIVSSHILADLAEYCTHIAIIEHGRILRYGAVSELHGRAAGRHHYQLTLSEPDGRVADILSSMEGVTGVAQANGTWTLEYFDEPRQAAHLLRALVGRDVPVASFTRVSDDLEQMYLQSGVRQVD